MNGKKNILLIIVKRITKQWSCFKFKYFCIANFKQFHCRK